MNIDIFFNTLFPGDIILNIPKFTLCDERYVVDGFLQSIPKRVISELDCTEYNQLSPKDILKRLKSRDVEIQLVVNDALSFYFSRVNVVIPLTGRLIPLTTSGIAKF